MSLLLVLFVLDVAAGLCVTCAVAARPSRHATRHACVQLQDAQAELPSPGSMKNKELKAELDECGVVWRGVAFDKEALVAMVEASRNAPPPQPLSSSTQTESEEAPVASDDDDGAVYEHEYKQAYANALGLKVKDIRAALAARSVGWADLFEKEDLAARLAELEARAALFSRSGALLPGVVGKINGEQCRQEMADARTPLLLDVYATWCGPCKMIAPMLESLASKLGSRARVAKLDSDAEEAVSSELRVQGLPTLIFFKDGREVHRLEGVPPGVGALEQLVLDHMGVGI